MEQPSTVQLRDLPYYNWTPFDSIGVAKNAINALQNGDLSQAANLVDAMRCDDRIGGCLMTRTACLPSLPITFAPAKGRKGKSIATELEENFECMFDDKSLREILQWWTMLGAAFAEIIWKPEINPTNLSSSRWKMSLKVWHPQNFHFNHSTRSFWVNHMDGQSEIKPGDGKWIVFTAGAFERCFLYGKVRELYMPWLLRQWARRDVGRYSEVYGQPIRAIYTPRDADERDKARFMRENTSLGTESVIRLPQGASKDSPGFDIKLIEAQGRGFDGFLALAREVGNDIAISLLGQNLTTEVRGGSFAAAQVHENIRSDILKGDAELLSQCLREQALKYWAKYNFGDEELAPTFEWVTDPPGDKTKDAEFLKALGEGVQALKLVGAKPDIDKLLLEADIPVTAPAEEIEALPPPPQDTKMLPNGQPQDEQNQEPELHSAKITSNATRGGAVAKAVTGQAYIDGLVTSSTKEAAAVLAKDLEKVLTVILSSNSFDEMTKGLELAYPSMDETEMSDLIQRALLLASMNGIDSVMA